MILTQYLSVDSVTVSLSLNMKVLVTRGKIVNITRLNINVTDSNMLLSFLDCTLKYFLFHKFLQLFLQIKG